MHRRNSGSHHDGAARPSGNTPSGFPTQIECQQQRDERKQDCEQDGTDHEDGRVPADRRYSHCRHEEIVQACDARTHKHAAGQSLSKTHSLAARYIPSHSGRENRHQECQQHRRPVIFGGHRQAEGQHPLEMHLPDADPHCNSATAQPSQANPAARCSDASRKVERSVGGGNGDKYRAHHFGVVVRAVERRACRDHHNGSLVPLLFASNLISQAENTRHMMHGGAEAVTVYACRAKSAQVLRKSIGSHCSLHVVLARRRCAPHTLRPKCGVVARRIIATWHADGRANRLNRSKTTPSPHRKTGLVSPQSKDQSHPAKRVWSFPAAASWNSSAQPIIPGTGNFWRNLWQCSTSRSLSWAEFLLSRSSVQSCCRIMHLSQ